MPGRVFLTGGSGFVGHAVIDALLSRDFTISALANRRALPNHGDRLTPVMGDLFDITSLQLAMEDCDAVIHLVGIIMERPSHGVTFERMHHLAARNVIEAAKRAGIRRFIHMSALGVRSDAISEYHRTKFRAEEDLRRSGLEWTIIRPSVIHGPTGEFMQMEAAWARRKAPPFLFMPYFGAGFFGCGGAGQLQPVHVDDVARAFAESLENPKTIGEVYPLGGSEVVTWPQMHQAVARAVIGHKRLVLPIPVWKAKLLTSIIPGPLLPFNRAQVIMSQEENTCDLTKFKDDFGWMPRPFEESIGAYASQL